MIRADTRHRDIRAVIDSANKMDEAIKFWHAALRGRFLANAHTVADPLHGRPTSAWRSKVRHGDIVMGMGVTSASCLRF